MVTVEPPRYKRDAIAFLMDKGALTVTPDQPKKLKSGRMSPHFLNSGLLDDGESVVNIGNAYAQAALDNIGASEIEVVLGPPYKGISLSVMTAGGMHKLGHNVSYAFYRKEEKMHGEGTGKGETKAEAQKRVIVGKIPDNAKVILVDDVVTTGSTKLEALEVLDRVADCVKVTGGIILMDRQEVNEIGNAAVAELARESGVQFHAVVKLSDVIDYLEGTGHSAMQHLRSSLLNYAMAWGTPEIRAKYGLHQARFIPQERTVIPACDVDSIEKFEEVVKATADLPTIGAYKIPLISGREGWQAWVSAARRHTQKPLIYDGQKLGNDIPDTGRGVMQELKKAGFDAVILFPFTGPRTQTAWTGEAIQAGLKVIVGAEMTHPGFLQSEGGSITNEALTEIIQRAARQGVTHYVYPGNKPESIRKIIGLIRAEGIEPTGFSPGFVAQGGSISEAAKAAEGTSYHAIVGRGIYAAKDMRAAAIELARGL